jgi:GNAT superfamily N-acetyltransferase
MNQLRIVPATSADVPTLIGLIRGLAEYEQLSHEVVVTEPVLRESLFGANAAAEALLGFAADRPVAFAVYFTNFSTFLGRNGLYLEDLFVLPECRGRGFGAQLFRHVAQIAVGRNCGRMEWAVLDWNTPAIRFYQKLGARPMDQWTVQRLTGAALLQAAGPG